MYLYIIYNVVTMYVIPGLIHLYPHLYIVLYIILSPII